MDIIEFDSYIITAFRKYDDLMSQLICHLFEEERDKLFKEKTPQLRQYMDIVIKYVPYEIYQFIKLLSYDQKNEAQRGYVCEHCENCTDFIRNNDETICGICYSVIVQYRNYFESYGSVDTLPWGY